MKRLRVLLPLALILCLLLVAVVVVMVLPHISLAQGAAAVDEALGSLQQLGAPVWLGLAALQLIAVLCGVVPASVIGMATGALYGLWFGFTLAGLSTFAGAVLAFWLSRSLFRPLIERLVRQRGWVQDLDTALGQDAWRLVCLLRVSPVMPFVATSYLLGLSSVSLRDYTIGTLASLPALFGYVALGTLAHAGLSAWSGAAGPLRWGLLATGITATVALIVHLGRLVAKVGSRHRGVGLTVVSPDAKSTSA